MATGDASRLDDDWVIVKENRSIERGWGKAMFGGVDKENDENGRTRLERLDRVLTKYGYAKSIGEAKTLVASGVVVYDGVIVTRAEQKVIREKLEIEGRAFGVK